MNIFELLHKEFKWPKEKLIRMFETFAGIGAQAKAMERRSINHEVVAISEIDKDAIVSYAAIHCQLNELLSDYQFPSKETMVKTLQDKDVGYDFKRKCHTITLRTNIERLQKYYLADLLSRNLGNITTITAAKMPECDLLTYSFPCQDLSRAGRQKGMDKENHTRSGLLWEIERILDEAYQIKKLPTILVMENVPEVIGKNNYHNFKLWFHKLETLGYQSYYKIVDAANVGIPQHRERCFMISVLGNFSYSFPNAIPLNKTLKSMLEDKVDKKYFLSYNMLKTFMDDTPHKGFIRSEMFTPYQSSERKTAKTITTRSGSRPTDNFLLCEEIICLNYVKANGKRVSQTNRILDSRGIAVTLTCGYTGYYLVGNQENREQQTKCPIGKFILDGKEIGVFNHRLVRKLTPLEALRLMGFDDRDYELIKQAGVSEGQMLKQAGNSIVVDVLETLFMQFFL